MALLSRETINKVRSEDKAKKESFGTGDKRPKITAGEAILYISKAILKNTKAAGKSMIEVDLSESDQKAPIKEFFVIGGENGPIGLSKIVNFLANAFTYEIPECENEEAVLKEVIKFTGKPFKAAIKVKEQLWAHKDKDNQDALEIVKKPQLWYVGGINDTGFSVNMAKTVEGLSAEDKKNYVIFNENKGKNITSADLKKEEKSDLPF